MVITKTTTYEECEWKSVKKEEPKVNKDGKTNMDREKKMQQKRKEKRETWTQEG